MRVQTFPPHAAEIVSVQNDTYHSVLELFRHDVIENNIQDGAEIHQVSGENGH